jgi:hypothetical protein
MKKSLLSELINPSDFESLAHYIIFKNLTSGMVNLNIDDVKILKIGNDFLELEVPERSCSSGHQLFLFVYEHKPQKKWKSFPAPGTESKAIEVIANVVNVESVLGAQVERIKIQFSQFNVNKWKAALNRYLKRQKEINELFPSEELKTKKAK